MTHTNFAEESKRVRDEIKLTRERKGSVKAELKRLTKNKPTGPSRKQTPKDDDSYQRLAEAIMGGTKKTKPQPRLKLKPKHVTTPLIPKSAQRYEDTAEQQAERYKKMQRFVRKNLSEIAEDLVYRSKHAQLPKNSTYSKAVEILGSMQGNTTSMVESVVHSLCLAFTADNYDID
jgi:phytoene dehydrogenase-like protein